MTGPDKTAPMGRHPATQLAASVPMSGTWHSEPQSLMWGKVGEVQAHEAPNPNIPMLATKYFGELFEKLK